MLIKFLLNGKEINLTGDNVVIKSNNFNVDKNGDLTCTNANVNGKITSDNVNITGGKIILKRKQTEGDNSFIVMDENKGWQSWIGPGNAVIGEYISSSDGGVGIFGRATGGGQSSVVADNLSNYSLLEYKKNIKPMKKAIEIIRNTDICEYNMKQEKEKLNYKNYGVIIGGKYRTPNEIVSKNGKAINLYSMIAFAWKGIQEQQETIEKLQNEIKEMKEKK